MEPLVQTLQNCIISCKKCHDLCLRFIEDAGPHLGEAHRDLLLECAQACADNREHLGREPHSVEACARCAELCHKCFEAINGLPQMGDLAREVAEECHRCAALCEIVAEQTAMAAQLALSHPPSANGKQP